MTDAEFDTLLPKHSYVFIDGAAPGKRIGLIKRGEDGYYETDFDNGNATDDIVRAAIDGINRRLGVSTAQATAMHVGSMCGWHVPGADPRSYTDAYTRYYILGEDPPDLSGENPGSA